MRALICILLSLLTPAPAAAAAESCTASWYSTSEGGNRTASGIPLNDGALTAAHKRLPFGSRVRVTNTANGRAIVVTITDRGPFIAGRCIDLTRAGKAALGMGGLAPVRVEVIGR